MEEKFIEAVNLYMDRHNITKLELSKRIDIDQTTLGKYLLKQRAMPFSVVLAIANEFHLDINTICHVNTNSIMNEDEVRIVRGLHEISETYRVTVTLSILNLIEAINKARK